MTYFYYNIHYYNIHFILEVYTDPCEIGPPVFGSTKSIISSFALAILANSDSTFSSKTKLYKLHVGTTDGRWVYDFEL